MEPTLQYNEVLSPKFVNYGNLVNNSFQVSDNIVKYTEVAINSFSLNEFVGKICKKID